MPNLVKQHNNLLSSNYIICLDITLMCFFGQVLVVMDLDSRCVIGHCVIGHWLDTNVICDVLSEIIKKRSFLPEINILHSGRGSLLKNKNFISFLEGHNIKVSRGSSKGHENKVIKRFFRTLKAQIRSFLRPNWRALKSEDLSWDPLKDMDISKEEFVMVVKQEIEAYNCTPHSNFKRKASPNEMEEALFLKYGKCHPEIKTAMPVIEKSNISESLDFEIFKEKMLAKYQNDWAAFFHEWRLEQQAKTNEKIKELTEKLEESNRCYLTLYYQYLVLQAALGTISQEIMKQKANAESNQASISLKLQEAKSNQTSIILKQPELKKQPFLSINEFEGILRLVNGKSDVIKSRRILALVILYLTGLKVSNLLILTVLNGRELFSVGTTTINLIKGGENGHKLVLTKKGRTFLKKFYSDYENLSSNKKGSNLIFSAPKDNDMPFNSELFDRELNAILLKASTLYEKHLRTHSFSK